MEFAPLFRTKFFSEYFWEDKWVGDRPLCSVFPRHCHLSSLKHCFIYDFLVWSRSSISFSFGFSRLLIGKEMTKVVIILSLIGEFGFRHDRPFHLRASFVSLSFGIC